MRINRFLAHAGVGSRRNVEELVREGRVKVNGRAVYDLSTDIDQDKDIVEYAGRRVRIEGYHYLILNKPKGYLTTVDDVQNRLKVMDLVPERYKNAGVVPVGRLDRDTEGLLLMTNDGDAAYVLTHPKFEIEKEYLVELDRPLEDAVRDKICKGIFMYGRRTRPAEIVFLDDSKKRVLLKIKEGKKRQVRITFGNFSYRVKKLTRVSFGPLQVRGINSGSYRLLKEREIQALKKIVRQALKERGKRGGYPRSKPTPII